MPGAEDPVPVNGSRRRTLILLGSALLFLPPLALLPQLTADVNFCGRWCPRMFFVWREGTSLADFLHGMARSSLGVALVAAVLLTTLAFGRYWCSHLCPVGGALELGSRLVPSGLKIDFSSIPAPPFRYGYLLVYLVAPALGLGSLCCSYCNFAAVPRLVGAVFSEADVVYFLRLQGLVNLGLLVVLGLMARGGRAYCNLLCPVGALDALVNRVRPAKAAAVRVDPERCLECGECVGACPTWAVAARSKPVIDQLSCIPCGMCEEVCRHGAIVRGTAG